MWEVLARLEHAVNVRVCGGQRCKWEGDCWEQAVNSREIWGGMKSGECGGRILREATLC